MCQWADSFLFGTESEGAHGALSNPPRHLVTGDNVNYFRPCFITLDDDKTVGQTHNILHSTDPSSSLVPVKCFPQRLLHERIIVRLKAGALQHH